VLLSDRIKSKWQDAEDEKLLRPAPHRWHLKLAIELKWVECPSLHLAITEKLGLTAIVATERNSN
jgi:hypothetical protein